MAGAPAGASETVGAPSLPAEPIGRSARHRRLPVAVLGAVVLAFVVLGTVIAVKTPAWESADEPAHVMNVEALASGHWYGIDSRCRIVRITPRIERSPECQGPEAQQAPLYYLVMAGWQRLTGVPVRHVTEPPPSAAYVFGLSKEFYAHHSSSAHRFLLWFRIPNVLIGSATVVLAFFACRLATRDQWSPVVAAALVAFEPRFLFLSAFVTNDNLVDLLGALLALVALWCSRRPSVARMAAVGAVVGLLVTTKLSTIPVAIVLLGLAAFVRPWKERLLGLAAGVGSALVVSSWYLVQNAVRYGDPLARAASSRYLDILGGVGTLLVPYRVTDPLHLVFLDVPSRVVKTVWYQSGWNQFHWSWPVDVAITAVVLACILSAVTRRGVPAKVSRVLGSLVLGGLLSVWVLAFQTATYQGRYALVALAAFAVWVALGLERWCLPVRFSLPTVAFAGCLVALSSDVLSVNWT